MTARPTVTYDGKTYSLRSAKTEIPDLAPMTRLAVLVWLNRYTVPRGYTRKTTDRWPGLNLEIRP